MEPWKLNLGGPNTTFPQANITRDVASSSSSQQQPQPPPPQPSAVVPVTVQQGSSSSPAASAAPSGGLLMYKNRLQEFSQKMNMGLPMYQNVNEGFSHAPRFRSTVWVGGVSFTSQLTFSQRKAAEQDVAKIAFESLSKKVKDEVCPVVCQNTMFSKSILNEYATKLNVEKPTYNTVKVEGQFPCFVSTLVFGGTTYNGGPARNKKEAEQVAARAAIVSMLGDSSSGTLYEIVQLKSKILPAVIPNKSQCIDAGTVLAITNTGDNPVSLNQKDKEVAGLVAPYSNETKTEFPVPSNMIPSGQELQMPEHAPSAEHTNPTHVTLQPGSEQPTGDGSSSKKRRKNKKKANKKSRLEFQSGMVAFPVNQIPPFPVAQ